MMDDSRPLPVAVFGSSEPQPGSALYRDALELGRLLGQAGFEVINGGYGGVMEASASGARQAGASTIGVTVSSFTNRPHANQFIQKEIREPDLFARTRSLIEGAAAFIVLPGRSGTLAELAFLWALCRAGLLGRKPIVLLGQPWEPLLRELRRLDLLGETEFEATDLADDPRSAVDLVRRRLDAAS